MIARRGRGLLPSARPRPPRVEQAIGLPSQTQLSGGRNPAVPASVGRWAPIRVLRWRSTAPGGLLIFVGISFCSLQRVAFVIDTLAFKHLRSPFLDYMNLTGCFPQIVAGPIERRLGSSQFGRPHPGPPRCVGSRCESPDGSQRERTGPEAVSRLQIGGCAAAVARQYRRHQIRTPPARLLS